MKARMNKAASKALVYLEKSNTWKLLEALTAWILYESSASQKRNQFADVPELGVESQGLAAELPEDFQKKLKPSDRYLAPLLSEKYT